VTIDIPDHNHGYTVNIPDHDHDVSISDTSTDNTEFSNIVFAQDKATTTTIGTTNTTVLSFSLPTTSVSYALVDIQAIYFDTGTVNWSLFSFATNEDYPDATGFERSAPELDYDTPGTVGPYSTDSITLLVNEDISGGTLDVQAQADVSDIEATVIAHVIAAGNHTHDVSDTTTSDAGGSFFEDTTTDGGGGFFGTETSDTTTGVEPGIFTTTDTPSNVGVTINGNTVATGIGTGTFETTIDVGGEFTKDAWNTVEVSSDSLGIIEVSAAIDGYDQIGTN
jgi:hypothetical protein